MDVSLLYSAYFLAKAGKSAIRFITFRASCCAAFRTADFATVFTLVNVIPAACVVAVRATGKGFIGHSNFFKAMKQIKIRCLFRCVYGEFFLSFFSDTGG